MSDGHIGSTKEGFLMNHCKGRRIKSTQTSRRCEIFACLGGNWLQRKATILREMVLSYHL